MNPLVIVIALFVLHGVVGEEIEMPEEMSACNCATTSNEVVRIARNEVTSPFLDSIAKTGFFRQTLKSTTCLFPDYPCMKSLYTDAHDRKGECTPMRTEITIRVYKSDMEGDDKMVNISIPVDVGCACNAVNR